MLRKLNIAILSAVLVFALASCGSPQEKASEYTEKGWVLVKKGKPVKARLEFQNALQIDEDLTKAWYGMALVAQQLADWKRMFAILNKVVELDPKHVQARIRLSRILLAAGQLDKALEHSNEAMRLAPEGADVLSLRAAVLLKLEDSAGAIEFANRTLQKEPGNVDALIILASERLAADDAAGAIGFLDKGIAVNEKNVALQLIKIQALNKLEKLDSAEDIFMRLIEFYPETNAFKFSLARFYILHDRKAEAEQIYRDIMQAKPDDMKAKLDVVRFVNSIKGADAAIAEVQKMIKVEPDNMGLRYMLVQLQQSAGRQDDAVVTLQGIINKASAAEDRLKAKGQLAATKLKSGQKKESMVLVKEILAEDPRNEQALILKASQQVDNRQLDEAIANLRIVLKDTPNSARALLLLGKAHELVGTKELAEDHYFRAFQASKQAPAFGMPYAHYLLKLDRPERAGSVLEGVVRKSPNNLKVLTLLAQIRVGTGNWVAAQQLADRIKQLEGKGEISEQIMGAVYAGRQDYDQSIETFKRAHESSPSAVRPMVSLVRTYVLAGKEEEARSFIDNVLAVNENNVSARTLLGQLFVVQDEYEKAADAFRAVVELDPELIIGYYNLASLLMRMDQHTEALQVLETGLGKAPEDFSLLMARAGAYEQIKDFESAIAIYEALLKKKPNADVVANNLASLLSDHRDDEASLKRANKLATRFRSSKIPQFKDTLGWTYFRIGMATDATPLIEDATEKLPALPVIRYHLGMTYMAIDDKESARREFEKALELAGENPFIYREEVTEAIVGMGESEKPVHEAD